MRVGMEATGYSRWFERLLAELGFELWIGNAAVFPHQLQQELSIQPIGLSCMGSSALSRGFERHP